MTTDGLITVNAAEEHAGISSAITSSSFKLRLRIYRYMDERTAALQWATADKEEETLSAYEPTKKFFFPTETEEASVLPIGEDSKKRGTVQRVYTFGAGSGPGGSDTDVRSPLTGFSYNKGLQNAGGTFSINLKPVADWGIRKLKFPYSSDLEGGLGRDNAIYKYVDSGDWVDLQVSHGHADARMKNPEGVTANEGTWMSVFIGKVDQVSLNINPAMTGGATMTIAGRGPGAVFEDTVLYFNPYDELHANVEGSKMATIVKRVSGKPWQIVYSLLSLAGEEAATYGFPTLVPDNGLFTRDTSKDPPPFIQFNDAVEAIVETGGVPGIVSGKSLMDATLPGVQAEGMEDQNFQRGIIHAPTLLSPGQHTPLWDFVRTYGCLEFNEYFVVTRDTMDRQARKNLMALWGSAEYRAKILKSWMEMYDEGALGALSPAAIPKKVDAHIARQQEAAKKRAELPERRIRVVAREKPFAHVVDLSKWDLLQDLTATKGADGRFEPRMSWFHLETSNVGMGLVKRMSLGRTTPRFNHISVMMELPPNMNLDAFALCPPAANFYSIKRYGLKKLDMTLPLHAQSINGDIGELTASLKRWRDVQICWNVLNPFYLSGTITIVGHYKSEAELLGRKLRLLGKVPYFPEFNPSKKAQHLLAKPKVFKNPFPKGEGGSDIPYGVSSIELAGGFATVDDLTNLRNPGDLEDSLTFYIEGVSYSAREGLAPTYETVLTVSRGYPELRRLSDIESLYKMWTDSTGMSSV